MSSIIRIIGPGGCINNELAVIEAALRSAGYIVEVKNDNPDSDNPDAPKDRIAHITKLNSGKSPSFVTVEMQHQPWGG